MTTNIATALASLAAGKQSTARTVFAKAVAAQAAGRTFILGELAELADALAVLNVPATTADELAALYAAHADLRASYDALPTHEEEEAARQKLQAETNAIEDRVGGAISRLQHSRAMLDELADAKQAMRLFGSERAAVRGRYLEATARLASVLEFCPIPPAKAAEENAATSKAKKATAAAK